ncbi:MAG: hypothetical protein ISS69_18070 [Phycisphaerae bacterium]|nr:hypothetical protein [Phycisphaerae bacterium]
MRAFDVHANEIFIAAEFAGWFGDAVRQLLDRTVVVVSKRPAAAFDDNDGF